MQQAGEGTDQHFAYPALTGQYAVLVQGSNGFDNYRHQADVLSIYQSLRRGGYPDDYIILILDKKMASDPRNPEPGVVRTAPDGPDLLGGTTTGSDILPAMVDYDSADLTASDVADILAGRQSDHLPVVVPQDEGNNVLFYWSGHGRSTSRGGANEFSWRETSSGKGFSANLLKQTAQQMLFRKLLIAAEPCYGECVIRTVDGIPGVLAMSGANSQEQSWADCWSNDAIGGIAANQISTQASYAFLMANGGSAGAGGVINPIKMWGGYACSIASGLFSFLGNQLQDQVTTKTTPGKIDLTIDASIALNGYLKEFTGNNQSTLSVSAEGIYTANGESGHVGKGVWGLEEDPVVYIDKDDIISTQSNFNVGCTEDGYTNSTFADYDVRIVYAFDPTSVKINLNEDLFKGIDSVTVTTNVGVIPNLRYGNTDEYRKMLMLGDKTKKYARPSFSLAEGKTSGTLELSGRSMPVVTKVGLDELADGDYETAENCTIVTQKTSDGKGWQRFHGRLIDASSKQIIVDSQAYIPYSTDDDGKCTGIGIPTAPDFVVRVEVGFSAFGRQSESQALPLQQTLYSEGRSG